MKDLNENPEEEITEGNENIDHKIVLEIPLYKQIYDLIRHSSGISIDVDIFFYFKISRRFVFPLSM